MGVLGFPSFPPMLILCRSQYRRIIVEKYFHGVHFSFAVFMKVA